MPISAADIEFFVQHKAELPTGNDAAMLLNGRQEHGKIGIFNQGATCYLNSLLQSLYHDIKFRNLVFQFNGDAHLMKELQRLFSFLSLSETSAISSTDLITSFGWSKSQTFEQHDVHELFSILVDAISRISDGLRDNMNTIFQGQNTEIITCPECSHKSEKDSSFLSISVDLPDVLENKEDKPLSVNVKDMLELSLKPEILDADNMWECSGCSKKVQAVKSQKYQKLPDRVVLQLKRFRFDPTSRRRRKLTTMVAFPETLDLSSVLLGQSGVSNFNLSSILIHTGTAMGGHYRAFVRCVEPNGSSAWYDFNDANVSVISTEELASIFSGSPSDGECLSPRVSRYRALLQENAYMLIYDREGSNVAAVDVPTACRNDVESANFEFRNIQRAHEIRTQLYEMSVYLRSQVHQPSVCAKTVESIEDGCFVSDLSFRNASVKGNEYKLQLSLDSNVTLAFALEKVHQAFSKAGLIPDVTLENCRFRLYNEIHKDRLGETFGDRMSLPLSQLGLSRFSTMLLETRGDGDKPFSEHNPREMILNLVLWKDIESSPFLDFDAGSSNLRLSDKARELPQIEDECMTVSTIINHRVPHIEITVPGEDKSSVAALKSEALRVLTEKQVISDASGHRVFFIHYNDRVTVELGEDARLLRKDHGLWPGDEIIVDVAAADASESVAFQALKSTRSALVLSFNDPAKSGDHPEYDLTLETSLDVTLGAVKEIIAKQLGISDATSFHIRRSINGNQLKDDSKTLGEYGIVDRSILHVQMGRGCASGEHLLHLDLDINGDCISIGDIPAAEKMNVLQLKEAILASWAQLFSQSSVANAAAEKGLTLPAMPPGPKHLRLRDGKTGQAASLLRDDRVLVRCLLGISDGRRVVVQVLNSAESLSPDDILLTVRTLSYENKSLSKPIDVVVPRLSTAQSLYQTLLDAHFTQLKDEMSTLPAASGEAENFPAEFRVLEIAKALLTGPPLTLKGTSKLKWNDAAIASAWTEAIDRPPLSLRDGSILVVRSRSDYEKARAAAKARKDGDEGNPSIGGAAGGGAAAVKAKSSNIARIRAMSSQGRRNREQGITIEVFTGNTSQGTSTSVSTVLPDDEAALKPPPHPSNASSELPPSPIKSQ